MIMRRKKKVSLYQKPFNYINYEIPNIISFYDLYSVKKQKLFYLTEFLIKLSHKYCLKIVCITLLKRFLDIRLYKFTLKWHREHPPKIHYDGLVYKYQSLYISMWTFSNNFKFEIMFLIRFSFLYYIFFSYFNYTFISFLNSLSINKLFTYIFFFKKKKINFFMIKSLLIKSLNISFIDLSDKTSNSNFTFNNIIFLLNIILLNKKNITWHKKKFFLRKRITLFTKYFMDSDPNPVDKEDLDKEELEFLNLSMLYHSDLKKLNKKFNSQFLNKIHLLVRRKIYYSRHFHLKLYNILNLNSFHDLKIKKHFLNKMTHVKYLFNLKLKWIFFRMRKKFYRYLRRWCKHNKSLIPWYRKRKIFKHFRKFRRKIKAFFLSGLSATNRLESKNFHLNRNKFFRYFNKKLQYKFISILGKKKQLKDLNFKINVKTYFNIYLNLYYNINLNTFVQFIKGIKYKSSNYKLKDLFNLLDFKCNIFFKKFFWLNTNNISYIYSYNSIKKKNISNVLLNIGDVVFFKTINLNSEKFIFLLNFLFFVDPLKIENKKEIFNYIYKFISYNFMFNIDFYILSNTVKVNNNYLISFIKTIHPLCNSELLYIKSLCSLHYNFFSNSFFNILKKDVINKSINNIFNAYKLNNVFSNLLLVTSYIKYDYIKFNDKWRLYTHRDLDMYLKDYYYQNKYWKFGKWFKENYKGLRKDLLDKSTDGRGLTWFQENEHFKRWSKYYHRVTRKDKVKNIYLLNKKYNHYNKKLKTSSLKWGHFIRKTPFLPFNYYKSYFKNNVSFFFSKKQIHKLL